MAPTLAMLAEKAAELRQRAGLTQPDYSTRAIMDASFDDVVVTGRRLPAGVHEIVALTAEGRIIIYSRDLPVAKQRYAIAHALAHLIFDGSDNMCGPGFAGDPECEARADRFADELLLPLAELRAHVQRWPVSNENHPDHEMYLDQCDEIASHFNVPSYVVDKRIRELATLKEIA
jgi:Zn-dependent peptidase ImmA (M78 family)